MNVQIQVPIKASKEKIWKRITDIEHAADTISGIEKVEVLNKPASGFVDFKWRETRTLFGKTATEVMWITDAMENEYYKTRAESHGSIYTSTISIAEQDVDTCKLTMEFDAKPQSFGAKVMSGLLGFLMKGATKKALQKDLEDIKISLENKNN